MQHQTAIQISWCFFALCAGPISFAVPWLQIELRVRHVLRRDVVLSPAGLFVVGFFPRTGRWFPQPQERPSGASHRRCESGTRWWRPRRSWAPSWRRCCGATPTRALSAARARHLRDDLCFFGWGVVHQRYRWWVGSWSWFSGCFSELLRRFGITRLTFSILVGPLALVEFPALFRFLKRVVDILKQPPIWK